jgi:hypothetical protein
MTPKVPAKAPTELFRTSFSCASCVRRINNPPHALQFWY